MVLQEDQLTFVGPAKGFQGRIFRAAMDLPEGQSPDNRQDIECLIEHLPEPVDLDFDPDERVLYWSDRGEIPFGNSLSRCPLSALKALGKGAEHTNPKYDTFAHNFHEAIGLKLDLRNRAIYASDLGGCMYRYELDGTGRRKLYEEQGTFTGITMLYENMNPILDPKGNKVSCELPLVNGTR